MAAKKKRKASPAVEPKAEPAAAVEVEETAPDAISAELVVAVPATLPHAIQNVGPIARVAFERGRGQSEELVHDFTSTIRERPIRSLLVAAGLGFIVGLIWRH